MSDGSVTCAENGGFRTHLPLPPVEAIDTIKESLAAFVPVHIKYPAIRIICRSNEIFSNCEVRLLPASRRLMIYTNAHAGFMLDMSKALSVSVQARKAKFMRIRINFEFGRVQLIFPEQYGRWTLGILAAHEPGRALPGERKGAKEKEVGSNRSLNQSFEIEVVPWGKGAEPTKFEFDELGVVEVANESNTTHEHVDVYTKEVTVSQRSISTHEVSENIPISRTSFVESIQIQSTQSHHITTVISTMTIQTTSMVEMMETQKSDSRISIVSEDGDNSSSTTLYTGKASDSDSESESEAKSLFGITLQTPTSNCAKPTLSMRSTSSRLPQWPPPPSRESDSDSESESDSVSVDNFGSLYKASPEDRMLRRPTKDRFCPMVTESAVEAADFKQDWGLDDDAVSLKSNASTRCFFYNLDRATAAGENNAVNVDPSALKNTAYATGPMKSFNCLAAIRDKMNGYVVPQIPEFDDSTTNVFPPSPRSPGSPGVETTLTVPPIDPISPTPSNTSIATAIELGDCVGESFV
uniref:DUF667 domain-containing protein n=1 Tax=Panagrellus redivivus TaxID=6233 RepID=A0A7E4VIM7_PANRE